jgi:hypothetical protein
LAVYPSPTAAWFADTHLYSNLRWSPDGAEIFYEDLFIAGYEDGGTDYEFSFDMTWPEIRCVDVATGEAAGVVPGAIYINPAVTPVPIKIEKLYGFELCSAEAGLNPDAYSVAAIERARHALYVSEDFYRFVFVEYWTEGSYCDVVWEDARAPTRRVLAKGAVANPAYLRRGHGVVYTLEETEKRSGRSVPVTYLLDLRTGREKRLGSFYLMGVTADERRATGWRCAGGTGWPERRSVMALSLAGDETDVEEIFEDRFGCYVLSPGGYKLVYERENRLRAVDLTTGERADLGVGIIDNAAWSPDDRYLVFQLSGDNPSGHPINVVDTDARKLVGSFKSPYARFFSWSPSAKYVAFGTSAPGENLCVIDVEAGEEWPVHEGEAAFFCWVGGSRFLYSSGGKLYVYDCEKKEGRVVYAWFAEGDCEVLTWINGSQLLFVRRLQAYLGQGSLHLMDVRTGAHWLLAPGSGCDFYFAEDGNLVFRARDMPPGYPEYWELDFATGYAAPYEGPFEGVARRSPARGVVVPSPDGGRVAVLKGGTLTLQDADGGNAVTLMAKGKGANVGELAEAEPRGPAWSPAGDKVAWLRVGDIAALFTDMWFADRDGGDVRILLEADTNFNDRIYGKW